MTTEEAKKAFDELKQKEGMSEDDILVALGQMFKDGKITKDQLGALIYELGYEFTEEFANMSDEESKKSALEESEGESESEPEGEKPEEEEEVEETETEEAEETEKPEEDEDEERKKARELFGR